MSASFVRDLEGWALVEAEKHQPEPGGCTCGFCAWSVEHVVIMSLRAVLQLPGGPAARRR